MIFIDEEKMIAYIQKETGLEKEIIEKVLDKELEYLKEKGVVE